jgi:hypothetical protein
MFNNNVFESTYWLFIGWVNLYSGGTWGNSFLNINTPSTTCLLANCIPILNCCCSSFAFPKRFDYGWCCNNPSIWISFNLLL